MWSVWVVFNRPKHDSSRNICYLPQGEETGQFLYETHPMKLETRGHWPEPKHEASGAP